MIRRHSSFREDYLLVVRHWFTILYYLLTEQIKGFCHSFSLNRAKLIERYLFSMTIHTLIITEDLRQVLRMFVRYCPLKVSRVKLRSLWFISLSWNWLSILNFVAILIENLCFLLYNNWFRENFPFFFNINCLFNAKLQTYYTSNLTNVFFNCEKFVHRSQNQSVLLILKFFSIENTF